MKSEPDANHPPITGPLSDITTERLDLRKFREDDLDELCVVFANPEVWQFPYGRAFTQDETTVFLATQIRKWEACGFGCWIARERRSGRVIGYVGLSVPNFLPEVLPAVEVGWRFEPSSWGKGYATEGARAALDEAFTTLGLKEICSVPQAENPRSAAVCERIGMSLEREVTIPANSQRGELRGLLYRMTLENWRS